MLVEILNFGIYRGYVGFTVDEVFPKVKSCGSQVNYCLFHHQLKQYLTHTCSLHYVLMRFHHNVQVCSFGDGIIDLVIHLEGLLVLPDLLTNVDHGVILDILYSLRLILRILK